MTTALALLATLAAALAAAYRWAPARLFGAVMALARRAAGLRLGALDVDGHRIVYLDGNAHGEPLLLLHGFGADKDHWTPLAGRLRRRFRVIAPDLPGFGESSRLPQANYGLEAQLARLAGVVAALGLTRFHLGGNSMGGYLAAHYAARHPEQVASLCLLAPAGVLGAPPSELQEALAAGDNPLIVADEAGFARLGALCFVKAPPLPRQFERVLAARAIADSTFNAKIFADLFASPIALEQALAGLDVPLLVVWGDGDRVLHPDGLAVLRQVVPQAEAVLMPAMGHVPMVERPADVAALLERYAADVAAAHARL
jgi:abhydrolase domain-containing protein 6